MGKCTWCDRKKNKTVSIKWHVVDSKLAIPCSQVLTRDKVWASPSWLHAAGPERQAVKQQTQAGFQRRKELCRKDPEVCKRLSMWASGPFRLGAQGDLGRHHLGWDPWQEVGPVKTTQKAGQGQRSGETASQWGQDEAGAEGAEGTDHPCRSCTSINFHFSKIKSEEQDCWANLRYNHTSKSASSKSTNSTNRQPKLFSEKALHLHGIQRNSLNTTWPKIIYTAFTSCEVC